MQKATKVEGGVVPSSASFTNLNAVRVGTFSGRKKEDKLCLGDEWEVWFSKYFHNVTRLLYLGTHATLAEIS